MNEIEASNSHSKAKDDVDLEFEATKVEMGDNFVVIWRIGKWWSIFCCSLQQTFT